jgi:hypothetical protein
MAKQWLGRVDADGEVVGHGKKTKK